MCILDREVDAQYYRQLLGQLLGQNFIIFKKRERPKEYLFQRNDTKDTKGKNTKW